MRFSFCKLLLIFRHNWWYSFSVFYLGKNNSILLIIILSFCKVCEDIFMFTIFTSIISLGIWNFYSSICLQWLFIYLKFSSEILTSVSCKFQSSLVYLNYFRVLSIDLLNKGGRNWYLWIKLWYVVKFSV